MESDTFNGDFMVKLVCRLSRDSMESDTFILLLTEWEVSAGIYCPQTFPY